MSARLLLCSSYSPSAADGASAASRELVKCLQSSKIDVTVYTTDYAWSEKELATVSEDSVKVFPSWFSGRFQFSPSLLKSLFRKLRYYDIVHFRGIFSVVTLVGAWISYLSRCPYVVSPTGDWPPSWSRRNTTSRGTLKFLYTYLLVRPILKRASYLVCTSEGELDAIRSFCQSANFVVIPEGVEVSKYTRPVPRVVLDEHLHLGAETKIFLFLGRIAREKSIGFLLDVWEQVSSRASDVCLVIAGGKQKMEYFHYVKGKIAGLSRPETVFLAGSVGGQLKEALLQHSICLLLPSKRESFGMVVLEALASGTPVIASEGTPWKSLEENGLGKWLELSETKWADSMLEAVENAAKNRESFRKRSQSWVGENYSWERCARKYSEIYEEVCRR